MSEKRDRQTAVHNFVLPTACYDDQTAVLDVYKRQAIGNDARQIVPTHGLNHQMHVMPCRKARALSLIHISKNNRRLLTCNRGRSGDCILHRRNECGS